MITLVYVLALGLPVLFLIVANRRRLARSSPTQRDDRSPLIAASNPDNTNNNGSKKVTIMQPPRDDLNPPKYDPITLEALKQFDGTNDKPIYVSVKGDVFDVTRKKDVYGPGGSYATFAGKDGSRGLGKSSLKPEDAVPDYSVLTPNEMQVLDDWHSFFMKRYNIVARVSDMPEAVARLRSSTEPSS